MISKTAETIIRAAVSPGEISRTKNTPANAPVVILAARLDKGAAISLYHHIKRPGMLIGPAWNKTAEEVIDSAERAYVA